MYIQGSFTRDERLQNSNNLYKVHSHEKSWQKIRKENGAKFYIVKYASKAEQKEVPEAFTDVGRFWGNSRDVPSKEFQEVDTTELELREYLEKEGLPVTNAPILPRRIINLK